MKSVSEIENKIEGWLKPMPHLPITWKKWLATNIWWLVLIGVIGLGISALQSMVTIFWASSVYYSYYSIAAHTGWWTITALIVLAFSIATAVIMAMAINPLKEQKKKGWKLLFIALLVGVLSRIVYIVINFSILSFIPSLIFAAIGVAISAYFLFEIRSSFNVIKATKIEKK